MARNALAAALALLALLIVPAGAAAAISSIADAPTWTIGQQPVEAFAPDGDRAWVGGNFINAGPRTGPGAAVDLAGNRIAGYAELTDSTGGLRVDAVTDDGAGGWYVAGTFTQAAGIARPGLVHLNADGSVDTAFNAQATAGTVRVLTRDGALLYVGGTFISIGGQTRSRLAALDAATGADTGWDAAVSAGGIVNSIAVDGGFAWVGGNFTAIGATAVNNAAKVLTGVGVFNADGSWVPQPTATVRAVLATPTDIYLGGDFTTVNGTTSTATNHIAKVDRTLGAPDAAWAPDANGSVLALVSDGATLYAGGPFTTFGGQTRRGTAATPLASAGGGAADTWYPGDLNQGGNVQTLALSGSTVYIGGSFTKFAGGPRAGLAAAPTTGTGAMSSWDPATTDTVRAVAAGANGAYAGGTFSGVNAVERTSLMALDLTTGAAMPYFSHTFDNPVHTITVCGDTVYAGGVFFNVDGQPRLDAAAFDRNTGALLPWDPSPDGDVWSIACANGAVYLGGQFITLDYRGVGTGTTRNGLAAVDPVTGALLPWDPAGTSAPSFVYSLAASGNTIYAAGQFAALNSGAAARNNLAAIDGTSGAVLPWNPNVTGRLRSIALAGSTMYAAGSLTAVGGNARGGIAEIDLGSGAPTAFDPGTNNDVSSLAVAPDGTLYVAGIFTTVGGANHQGAAAIAPNGTVSSWDPGLDGTADAAAVGADGRVYVGGSFTGAARRGTLGVATFSEPVGFASAPALSSTTPTAGESVSCSAGSASGSLPAPATYQWQLDGNAIGGATGSSYTPAATDVDHSLACEVMRHNLISSAQATSPSARVVAAPLPPASSSVTPDQAPAPTPGPTPFDIDGQATPPPPVVGKSVIATPSKGTVTVLLPGFKQYIPLPDAERIPVGTIIDATKGAVRLTTVGAGGKLQSAVFSEGVFQVLQETGKSPVVLVKLFGGSFKACPVIKRSAKRALDAATKVSKTKSIRHLWGEGSGLFRTQGRYASATIRGTKWVTDDRCDGTLIRVTKGSVTVRDIPRRKTFALKAPKRYLAQAK